METILKLFILLFFFTTPVIGQSDEAEESTAETEEVSEKSDTTKEEENKMSPIQEKVKSCTAHEGLFTIYQDTSSGKTYLQILSSQLGPEFIHFYHAEDGSIFTRWIHAMYGEETIFKIRKIFDKVEFVGQNTNFYFDPDNALSRSAHSNINEPVIHVTKVIAESENKDTLLIESDGLFLSEDFAQIKFVSAPGTGNPNGFKIGNLSKGKTRLEWVRSFPENTDWMVNYVYENPYPTNRGNLTTTDARFTTIQIQHSFVKVPENDYVPRRDDPRIGYFTSEITDQTSRNTIAPYRDVIRRWHLVKKDPEAELSEPVEPIVFWMENTTPEHLRPYVKRGIEGWNVAFEYAGFKNAVVAKQQPDDADWEAGDLRYNVIRWTSAPEVGAAWGPHFANPRTGQILGTDIAMDYIFYRGSNNYGDLYDVSTKSLQEMMFESLENEHYHMQHRFCNLAEFAHVAHSAAQTMAKTFGYDSYEMTKMTEEYIVEVVMHEVGHTLGLNHNFKGSYLWSPQEVNNREVTEKEGLVASVMEYTVPNITGNPETQGQYYTTIPGAYDRWAIEYGYSPALDDPEAEEERLEKILSRSTERELAFANDADDMRSVGRGIDPYANIWDLTDDIMLYGEERIMLNRKAMNQLLENMSPEGESYESVVYGYSRLMFDYSNIMRTISRFVGGVEVDRGFVGQEGADIPFKPVSADEQRRALNLLNRYAFSPRSFMADAEVYAHLQRQRRGFDWSNEDPKIHDRILTYQKGYLAHLMHPVTLKRMTDAGLYGNAYSVTDMMFDLTNGIFNADLKTNVTTPRQNLQVEYVNGLIGALQSDRYDHVAKSAALAELMRIDELVSKNKGKDAGTKAHRAHLAFLIDRFLDED